MYKPTMRHLTGFALALSIILCGSTVYYANRETQYENHARIQNQRNLSQLLNSINHLETSLEKAQYVPEGAMRQTLAADIWKESQLAAAALSSLPLGDQRLDQVESYISKIGDYAYYLMRSSAYDRADTQEWETLCSLCGNAAEMLSGLGSLKEQIDTGSASFQPVAAELSVQDGVSSALQTMNDEFPEYASLIYDGPYSDHISQRTPKALADLPEISQTEAAGFAAKYLEVDTSDIAAEFESDGQIPCYGFHSGTKSCTITKNGGLLLSLSDNREIGAAALTAAQAVEYAKEYLSKLDITTLEHSYYTIYESIVTISFHVTQDDILIYPDLIKVGVALDDGSIVRLDAAGYIMNHHPRQTESPAVSAESCRKQIPSDLKILSEGLAYIPTTGYNEVLCWEYVCETKENRHVLIYINTNSGQVENLLLLIEDSNGTLTR